MKAKRTDKKRSGKKTNRETWANQQRTEEITTKGIPKAIRSIVSLGGHQSVSDIWPHV
jgi:hypothetical protein